MIEGTKMNQKHKDYQTEKSFDYWANIYQRHKELHNSVTLEAFIADPGHYLDRSIECSLPDDNYLPLLPAQQKVFCESVTGRSGISAR